MGDTAPLDRPFIGGSRVDPHSAETFAVVNPADCRVIAYGVECDRTDVDAAVDAARDAQRVWAKLPAHRRAEVLWRWADLIASHGRTLAEIDTRNTGRALRDTLGMAPSAARTARFWAGMTDKIWGDQVPVTPGHLNYTVREPVGVCGVIMPWNGPVANFSSRVTPALACGNAVVAKPSEHSSLSAGLLAELTVDAGMPRGLVNIVTGGGRAGSLVASHPGVAALSFTGSVPTGRAIAHAGADTFKTVVLELGGKSPTIVFADADLEQAVRGSVWGVFQNAGQVCVAGTRLLVQREVADSFTNRLIELARGIRVGHPMDVRNHIGAVVSRTQYERVLNYLDIGRAEGARVALGGGRPEGVDGDGLYVAPTVFVDAHRNMRIATEEIFGPVLTVLPFDDESDALAIANGVEYGLAATVWTSDSSRMLRVAEHLDVGIVSGNTQRVDDPALPFGGFKNSGSGNAYSRGAIEGNTRTKRVSIRYDPDSSTSGWNDLEGTAS